MAEEGTEEARKSEEAYHREDPTDDSGEDNPVMFVHRVRQTLLSYSYRTGGLLGAPG